MSNGHVYRPRREKVEAVRNALISWFEENGRDLPWRPFCEAHWREAEMSTREELSHAVVTELDILVSAEKQRPDRNRAVLAALETAVVPGWGLEDRGPYAAARAAAFPAEGREDLTDPGTMAFDYERHGEDVPSEWWEDARIHLLRFLRQASVRSLPGLTLELEGMRERATVQVALAERDMERRYVAPRKAALRAKERAGG